MRYGATGVTSILGFAGVRGTLLASPRAPFPAMLAKLSSLCLWNIDNRRRGISIELLSSAQLAVPDILRIIDDHGTNLDGKAQIAADVVRAACTW